ncbi:MAG: helix-turn-helix domain-containing protein [Microcoleus sp. SIO2G3]|nr:helix-turn-helix domain-containing protein [Microcoleus sp. SIO2G3]
MPGRRPKTLTLSTMERASLEQLVKRPSTAQQIAQRGRIILKADEGKNHAQIARELDISLDMARLWRSRWLELSNSEVPLLERLSDAYRPGAPAKFTLEQQVQLMALACEDPALSGRPISQWSARELADEMVKRHVVEQISERHVGRLLAEAEIKPHQSRYWLHPPLRPGL